MTILFQILRRAIDVLIEPAHLPAKVLSLRGVDSTETFPAVQTLSPHRTQRKGEGSARASEERVWLLTTKCDIRPADCIQRFWPAYSPSSICISSASKKGTPTCYARRVSATFAVSADLEGSA